MTVIAKTAFIPIRTLLFKFIILLKPRIGGAADAEIIVPSGENTELKRTPFKA